MMLQVCRDSRTVPPGQKQLDTGISISRVLLAHIPLALPDPTQARASVYVTRHG